MKSACSKRTSTSCRNGRRSSSYADSGELRLTILYNPELQGSICDGAIVPNHGSMCGKAFRTGKSQHFNSLEEVRDDPRVSVTTWAGFSTNGSWRQISGRTCEP